MLKSITWRMPDDAPGQKRGSISSKLSMPGRKPELSMPGHKPRLSMKDVLLWSKGEPPKPGPRRIGIHTSTAGGVQIAAERAYRLGANTLQIFSSSPRQWKPYLLAKAQCDEMRRLRDKYEISPLAIHSRY